MAVPKKNIKQDPPFNLSERCEELKCLLKHSVKKNINIDALISEFTCESEADFLKQAEKMLVTNDFKLFEQMVRNPINICNQYNHGNA